MPKPACAKEAKEGVIRTFAVIVNLVEQAPDFYSEQSLGLVVAPADPTDTVSSMMFVDFNFDERFNSTVWEHRDAMHIMKGGAEIPGFVVWLVTPETPEPPPTGAITFSGTPEPPPTGAITFSGPDSPLILDQECVYYQTYGSKVQIIPLGGNALMWVVTAVFSR